MKRLLAFLLVFAVALSMGALTAIADDPQNDTAGLSDVVGTQYEEAVGTLVGFKVLTGFPDGTFRPEELITRAEFAAIATRLLSLGRVVEAADNDIIFSDVPDDHWALKNINIAFEEGIINGFPDGTFRPEERLTYEQAVKIIIQSLGLGEQALKKGDYPWGYLLMASETGVISGAGVTIGEAVDRGTVAKMLFAALYVPGGENGTLLADTLGGITYYVSPDGLDTNPGTLEKPWKSMKKAANTVEAGATVIFEDGVYYEDSVTSFKNSGEEGAPIILKARNKHGAVIIYPENAYMATKISISLGQKYITIQDFEITQVKRAEPTESNPNPTSDILLACRGQYCSIIGNKFYNAYEEAIKVTAASDILVEGNIIIGMIHEGIDVFNTINGVIRYNEVIDAQRVGIMVKGNSRNCLVYNNYIHNEEKKMSTAGFTVGGVSNNTSPFDVAKDTGFEAYYSVFYNNIIRSETPGLIPVGIYYMGAIGCQSYNNLVIGSTSAFAFRNNSGVSNGWGWDAPVIDPVIKNNILVNCSTMYNFVLQPQNLISSNNLYFNTPGSAESGSKSADPMFVNIENDWHLKKGSPAIGAGVAMPEEIIGYGGAVVKIDLVDYAGEPRTEPWAMGIYNAQ